MPPWEAEHQRLQGLWCAFWKMSMGDSRLWRSRAPIRRAGICQALFNEHVQIVGSRITAQNGRVKGRFEVTELSELPIDPSRRQLIKLAILSAVDNLSKEAISLMVG